ncbi:c-type cytochrome [Flavobacterium salilacus subsp. salilacus]|uniref:c-type cytochrome n=1 Tax=Flavobacterium TaxID=237 RepID=UPI00107550A7|nr:MULTISPECIES: c-type cytochrome [Flavobacterium]KAF2518922.1 c-type cytochrome [Flavobacterium salilacus subsp. salilacus]MBE1614916.1 c-type cytochrome [Flavobacterium sp. SaA2.13]
MKYLFFILMALSFLSCKKEEQKQDLYPSGTENVSEGTTTDMTESEKLGQELFNGKGNCFSCHKADQKVIGPSITEIAKIYTEKNGDMAGFLREKADPIVDPSQYSVMKTNFYITKNFTDEEMQGVVDYVMSFKK